MDAILVKLVWRLRWTQSLAEEVSEVHHLILLALALYFSIELFHPSEYLILSYKQLKERYLDVKLPHEFQSLKNGVILVFLSMILPYNARVVYNCFHVHKKGPGLVTVEHLSSSFCTIKKNLTL